LRGKAARIKERQHVAELEADAAGS
jgi:hypothetical protein